MERTMTIKKFFAPSTTRLGRQQWFRNVWQRLTMVLMIVILTTATGSEAWSMQIFVHRMLTDKTITLEVETTDSHEAIKEKIREKAEIDPANQWLVYGDTKLYDGKTLSDYNIQAESTIKLYETSVTNGFCGIETMNGGANVSWTYDESLHTLTIGGDGPMMYYNSVLNGDQSYSNGAPWKAFAGEIEHVIIENGITYVGSNTFAHCPNISSVTLPTDQHFYEIGPGAFGNCTSLTSIDIPMSVNKINDGAFAGCSNLSTVTLGYGNGATFTIGTDVFPATTTIIVPLAALQSYYNATSWESYKTQLAASGSCGKTESDHVTWTLTRLATGLEVPSAWEEDKDMPGIYNPTEWTTVAAYKLTISGTGAMADYDGEGVTTPWAAADFFFYDRGATYESYSDKSAITELEIGAGITALGSNAFKGLLNLKSLTIADGTALTTIDPYDFFWDNLTTVSLPEEISITVNDGGTLQWLVNSDAWRPYYNQMTPLYGYCGTTANAANGQNLSWTLAWKGEGPESYGHYPLTLTITGTGAMADYGNSDDTQAPWGTNFTILSLPDGLTTIGKYAFYRCTISGALNIPESVISIDDKAFSCNFYLTTVTIPGAKGAEGKALTTIGFAAFELNHNLVTITLGDGVKAINEMAFQNTYFTAVTIPNSVESIGNNAFLLCPRLTTVTMLGETPPALIASAFYNCDALTTIIVPAVALQSYLQASSWCAYADKVMSTGYCGKDNTETTDVDESHNVIWTLAKNTGDKIEGNEPLTLTISKNPEVTAEGADFSMADGWPFDDGDGGIDEVTTALSITQAVIGEGVTSIGASAFMNCENMATVSIPSTVTSIGVGAFFSCKSLTSDITIPDGVTVINNSTFNGCEKLTTVVLPSGLTTIGASAFAACYKLESIGVAGSTTNELPTSLTAIGTSAFTFSSLPAITLNEGLETIAGNAFSYTNLTTINIPASVENIGEGAFTCNYLESISVADGNTHFITDGDKALIALIDDNNKSLLTYARANTETTSYAVPDGVTRIGADAFSDSDHLTEVILPEGLVTIGNRAFFACDELIDIAIPATVESIGTYGFGQCSKLATIRVFRGDANGITTIGVDAFTGVGTPGNSSRCIYVPLSALNTYRTAVNWEKYYSGGAYWIFAGDETELFSSTATNAWMTWCSDKAYGKPVGCKAYTVSAVNDGEVTLTPVAGLLLPAYTPLLIKRDDTSAALTAIGGAAVTEPASGYNTTTGLVTKDETGFSMLGAAKDADVSNSITAGYSYALFDGEFLKIDDSTLDIPAHRCILTLDVPLSAPRLHININGEATSLSEAKEDSSLFTLHSSLSGWYTLDGRKLDKQPTTKGLYIYKGKKVVIK